LPIFSFTAESVDPVMLREALQRNAKHEARLSNISGYLRGLVGKVI